MNEYRFYANRQLPASKVRVHMAAIYRNIRRHNSPAARLLYERQKAMSDYLKKKLDRRYFA